MSQDANGTNGASPQSTNGASRPTNGASRPSPRRGEGGRFLPGSSGNPGGRPRSTRVYLEEAMNAVPLDRWRKIVLRALKDAEDGDKIERRDARLWLAKIFGLEKLEIGVMVREDPEMLRLAALGPRELLDEYRQVLGAQMGEAFLTG